MLQEMRKKSLKNGLLITLILLAAGIALIVIEFNNTLACISGVKDFNEIESKDIKNKIVDIEVYYSLGIFAEYYTENKDTKVKTTTDLYYIIETIDDKYMGISVPVSNKRTMEKMTDSFWAWYAGDDSVDFSTTLTFRGMVRKMKSEEYEFFKETMLEMGLTEEEFESNSIPYAIFTESLNTEGKVISVYVFDAIAILLILWSVLRFVKALSGSYQKKMVKYITNLDGSLRLAESDYASAAEPAKGLKIGRYYSYFFVGAKSVAVKNSGIVWAYYNRTTHRTNGVKTSTTYSITLYDYNKVTYSIPVGSEESAIKVLDYISQNISNAVVGFTDELKAMFRKDYSQFLNLRYNNHEVQNDINESAEAGDIYAETASASFTEGSEEDPFTKAFKDDPFATGSSDDPFAATSEDDPFASILNRKD